jgi:hypothetical protein
MSWGVCYSGSNNIHFNSPAIMADGRNYASWQPEAVINERIQQTENIKSNWQYREYLTKNAMQIMNINNQEACYELGLPCHEQTEKSPSSNVPYKFQSIFDSKSPGYGYCNSDLKNPYLSREQLNARLISASVEMNAIQRPSS